MKLKYIFAAIVAALTLAVGCEDDIETHLDGLRVSSSYIALPAEGGTQTITVRARYAWSFGDIPEWLEVTPDSGLDGETEVTFKAGAATSTLTAELYINCREESQVINVIQMTEKVELPIISCKKFNEEGEDGKSYRIKGTVTKIVNTTYGNMYIDDGTGEAYVYGTLDAGGNAKNFLSLGIEIGDVVTVEGPRTTYNETVELVDVSVISIEKSLIKVDSVTVKGSNAEEFVRYTEPLALEGGVVKAYLTCKGTSLSVNVPADAQSWLSVTSVETSGNSGVVTFNVSANALGDRTADLTFNTVSGTKTYTAQTTLDQKGSILTVSVSEFLAAAVSPAQYRLTGTVTNISVDEKYGNAGVTLSDPLGNSVFVYRMKPSEGKKITDLNIGVGDKLTVIGQRGDNNGSARMINGVYESHIHYTPATIKEFLEHEVSDVDYIVIGKITNIKEISAPYKNATLTISDDEGNSLYIFRMKPAEGGLAIEKIGLKVGDILTVIGKRGEYKKAAQMVSGYYVSHVAGSSEPEPEYETIWSEDWSSYKANDVPKDPYTCTGNGTKIYAEALAGGVTPEILVGKNKGSLAIKISDLKGKTGDLKFSYKCNKDYLTVTCSDGVTATATVKGKEFTLAVPSGVKSFTITITNPNAQNARVDDLVLEGKKK